MQHEPRSRSSRPASAQSGRASRCDRSATSIIGVGEPDGGVPLAERIELEDEELDPESYLAELDRETGIVEERIEGEDDEGELGVRDEAAIAPDRSGPLEQLLAQRPVAAVDERDRVEAAARLRRVELRDGTTHPFFVLQTLTDRVYDPLAGECRTRMGDLKRYAATDHLEGPGYSSLTPDDLLDLVAERGIGWDAEHETGVALHLVSALAVAGRVGLTAIGFISSS